MPPPYGKPQIKVNHVTFSMALEEMLAGPFTAQAVAEYTGLTLITVQHLVRVMRQRKLVHICGYEKDSRGRWIIRVFKLGEGKDVKRPPPKTRAERKRGSRERKRIASMISATAAIA